MVERLSCFVIMPYSKNSDMVFKNIIAPTLNKLPNRNVIALRADQMIPKELTLKAHVESSVKSADLIIADITGLNPNVLYEVGYASALGKQIVYISEETSKNVPVDLYSESIVFYKRENLLLLKDQLSSVILHAIERIENRRYLQESKNSYEITCYLNRDKLDLKRVFNAVEKKIDILEINLNSLAARYLNNIKELLNKRKKLRIRVLTLNPESDLAARRAKQLGMDTYTYRMESRESIDHLYKTYKDFKSNFELRLYDDIPNQIIYRIDDKVIIAVNPSGTHSSTNIHFLLDINSPGVMKSIITNFKNYWAMASPVTTIKL